MASRLLRIAVVLISGVLVAYGPDPAGAAVPEYQRVIKARSAAPTAALVAVQGCIRTEIWAASSDNVFGGRPGRVAKQGLTSVVVTQYDDCIVPGSAKAGGGGSGVVVFDGFGQTLDRLRSAPRFDRAWVDVTLPVVDDISGRSVLVRLALTWTPTGAFDRDLSHTHVRVPHEGIVNSHTQTLTSAAVISGSVWMGADRLTFEPTEGAVLSQLKYGCQVIVYPHTAGSDLSC